MICLLKTGWLLLNRRTQLNSGQLCIGKQWSLVSSDLTIMLISNITRCSFGETGGVWDLSPERNWENILRREIFKKKFDLKDDCGAEWKVLFRLKGVIVNFVIYYVAPISPTTTKKKIQSYLTGFFLNRNLTLEAQNKHISKIVTNKILVIILTLQAAFLRSGLYRVRLLALIFAIFVSTAPETERKRSSEIVCDKNKSVEFRDCKVRVSVNFFWGGKYTSTCRNIWQSWSDRKGWWTHWWTGWSCWPVGSPETPQCWNIDWLQSTS